MPRYFFHPLNYWDISQQCTPKINWHQSYYNHGIATSERAAEGASPYNSEITASSEHGRTMFAPTDVCGVIKGCEINNNAKCQGGVGCRGRQPLQIVRGSSLCRKIATLFADLHLLRARVGGADFVLRYGVCLIYGSRVLFTL